MRLKEHVKDIVFILAVFPLASVFFLFLNSGLLGSLFLGLMFAVVAVISYLIGIGIDNLIKVFKKDYNPPATLSEIGSAKKRE